MKNINTVIASVDDFVHVVLETFGFSEDDKQIYGILKNILSTDRYKEYDIFNSDITSNISAWNMIKDFMYKLNTCESYVGLRLEFYIELNDIFGDNFQQVRHSLNKKFELVDRILGAENTNR